MRTLPDALLRPLLLSYVTTYLAPSHGLFRAGAILVNRDGTRFCDETNRPQDAIGRQPEQIAHILFDQAIAERFEAWPNFVSTAPGVGYAYLADYARSRPDIYHRATSPEALATALGVPGAALAEALASAGLEKGPFHALGPAKSWIVFSEGGLKVDRSLRVLDRDGAPIPGLYAAGSAGQGGLILEGHGHHLAWAFTSGRLAGSHAAAA
jgi:fumarate reductase flavoprotein subunit